jgi:hypothetical protein
MAKVSIATLDKAAEVSPRDGFFGGAETRAYFDRESDPIHLHWRRLDKGDVLQIGPMARDCVAYVRSGAVKAGATALADGSSFIVEHGAALDVVAQQESVLLTFASARAPAAQRAGGHVHLLPTEAVPRLADLGGGSATGGGMHADASCPTCEVWLHENKFPPSNAIPAPDDRRGVHSHSEDEVIFVTSGQIRLGARLYGPGAALAIAADTMYSFTPGPDGLSFINFRAARPSEIRFANGSTMDEVAYWRDRLPKQEYITL